MTEQLDKVFDIVGNIGAEWMQKTSKILLDKLKYLKQHKEENIGFIKLIY